MFINIYGFIFQQKRFSTPINVLRRNMELIGVVILFKSTHKIIDALKINDR